MSTPILLGGASSTTIEAWTLVAVLAIFSLPFLLIGLYGLFIALPVRLWHKVSSEPCDDFTCYRCRPRIKRRKAKLLNRKAERALRKADQVESHDPQEAQRLRCFSEGYQAQAKKLLEDSVRPWRPSPANRR